MSKPKKMTPKDKLIRFVAFFLINVVFQASVIANDKHGAFPYFDFKPDSVFDKKCLFDGKEVNLYHKKVNESDRERFLDKEFQEIVKNLDDGAWIILYKNNQEPGKVFLMFEVKSKFLNGQYKEYHPSGLVKVLRSYENGKKEGIFALWSQEGLLASVMVFNKNIAQVDLSLNREGKVEAQTNHYGRNPSTKVLKRPKRLKKQYRYLLNFSEKLPPLDCST